MIVQISTAFNLTQNRTCACYAMAVIHRIQTELSRIFNVEAHYTFGLWDKPGLYIYIYILYSIEHISILFFI